MSSKVKIIGIVLQMQGTHANTKMTGSIWIIGLQTYFGCERRIWNEAMSRREASSLTRVTIGVLANG